MLKIAYFKINFKFKWWPYNDYNVFEIAQQTTYYVPKSSLSESERLGTVRKDWTHI